MVTYTFVHSVLNSSDRNDQYCSVAMCLSVVALRLTDCAKVK